MSQPPPVVLRAQTVSEARTRCSLCYPAPQRTSPAAGPGLLKMWKPFSSFVENLTAACGLIPNCTKMLVPTGICRYWNLTCCLSSCSTRHHAAPGTIFIPSRILERWFRKQPPLPAWFPYADLSPNYLFYERYKPIQYPFSWSSSAVTFLPPPRTGCGLLPLLTEAAAACCN